MKFYTDGSRIGLNKGEPCIGWAAVCILAKLKQAERI